MMFVDQLDFYDTKENNKQQFKNYIDISRLPISHKLEEIDHVTTVSRNKDTNSFFAPLSVGADSIR